MKYVECDVTGQRCAEQTSSVLKVTLNDSWSIELDVADDALVLLGLDFAIFGGGETPATAREPAEEDDDDDDESDEGDGDDGDETTEDAEVEEKLGELVIRSLRADVERRKSRS